MLDPNAIAAAIGLNQDLSGKGYVLGVAPDSALAMLVRETPVVANPQAENTYEGITTSLVDVSRQENHAALMNQVVDLATGAVRRTLTITRNDVMPHIRRVLEAHAAAMEAWAVAPMPYNTKVVYLPEVYKTSGAQAFIDRWENILPPSDPGNTMLGNYSPEDILGLVKLTTDEGFNVAIEKLLNADGGEGLKQIAAVLSGQKTTSQIDAFYSLPLALVLTNIETPREGVNMSLGSYKAACAVMANIAARIARNLIGTLADARANNRLYYGGLLAQNGVITVTGEVYRDMLDKGLTVEAIIGNEILGRKFRGIQLIDPANIAAMTEAFDRDKLLRQQAHNNNRRAANVQVIQNVLREDQQKIAAEGTFPVEGDTLEKSWVRLRSFVDSVYKNHLWKEEDTHSIIAGAICAVWYAHTDAARLIDIMFRIELANKDLPPKEIATLATIQYISEWVAAQVSIHAQADVAA